MKLEIVITELTNAGYEPIVKEVMKDGKSVKGVTVKVDGKAAPVVYPELMGKRVDVVAMIREALNNAKNVDEILLKLRSWEYVKENIYIGVRPITDDDSVIKKQFLDLEKYLYVKIDGGKINVTPELAEQIGDRDIWGQAEVNTENAAVVMSIAELLGMSEESPMTVISNKDNWLGAGAITTPSVFKTLANKEGSDLFIIPSSRHELIAVNKNIITADEVKAMVKGINNTDVAEEDRLSYSVYTYLKDLNKIVIE